MRDIARPMRQQWTEAASLARAVTLWDDDALSRAKAKLTPAGLARLVSACLWIAITRSKPVLQAHDT